MGAYGSRTVAVQVDVDSTDLFTPLIRLFINFISLGFFVGLLLHEHDHVIWGHYFNEHLNLLRYGKGLYFLWYVLTWYTVFAGLYVIALGIVVHHILLTFIGFRHELECEMLLEFLFGLWAAGQVVGNWVDFSRRTDCLATKDCESYLMQSILYSMEYVCEYFIGYYHDPERDVYIRVKNNFCDKMFHAVPTFLMTIISTSLSYVMLLVIGPK